MPKIKSILFALSICAISAGLVVIAVGAFLLRDRNGIESTPGNGTLFEVRQQCNELAAYFPVDLGLARQRVPPRFELTVDDRGNATGAFIFMNCPKCFSLTTPNSPTLQNGDNTAPGSVVHLWFMLSGPAEVLPVPGAQVTSPTQYAYAVADLLTSPVATRVYRRAGKNAVLIDETTLADEGKRQTGTVIFSNGNKIVLNAYTPTQLPRPLRVGGNVWNWHLGDGTEMGDDLDVRPGRGLRSPGNVNTTRVMFLASAPGPPNLTRVTIHAEPCTSFANYYGFSDVVASRATFFRPNNIVNNSSRGKLAWTIYPPYDVNCSPVLRQ